jgi:hypothetical protein
VNGVDVCPLCGGSGVDDSWGHITMCGLCRGAGDIPTVDALAWEHRYNTLEDNEDRR